MNPRPASSRAISAAEVLVATLLLAGAIIPIYSIFVRSSTTITRSRIAYMAMQVARERLEELRQIPPAMIASHDWQPVEDHLFGRTLPLRGGATSPVLARPLVYPDEYQRIQTRLTMQEYPPDAGGRPRLWRAILEVRYQETGAGSEKQTVSTGRFETILGDFHVGY